MKQLKWILPLAFLAILLGGCPYSSDVPIDSPSVKVDERLLGKWEPKTSESEYTVTKSDDYTFHISKKSKKSDDNTTYTAYLSNVGGDQFLNLREDGQSSKSYFFYKLKLSPTGMKATLIPVTENIDEKFETSAELKAFIEKNKNLSFFFDKTEDDYIKSE